MNKWKLQELVYIGIFGALWGGLEMSLGAWLHAIKMPFLGTTMAAVGMIIVLIGRRFVPRSGSLLMMGLVTALLKAFSLGGVVLNPMIAIVAESALAELGLWLARHPSRWAFVLAGGMGVSWDFFHQFLTQGLLAGRGVLTIYLQTLEAGARLLGLSAKAVGPIIAALIVLRLVVGGLAGWLAWDLGRLVAQRLQLKVSTSTTKDPSKTG